MCSELWAKSMAHGSKLMAQSLKNHVTKSIITKIGQK